MSETLSAADQIRQDVATADETVIAFPTVQSDGSQGSVNGTIAPNTGLIINTTGGTDQAADLFLNTGYSLIENVNDFAPVIATGTDGNTTTLVYQGDEAGQTFYAGTGTEYAAFTGYGNTFTTPTVGGGNYEVSAGLQSANTQLLTLAAAPAAGIGNDIAIGSGNASIAAGLGYNHIFLGTGTALIANEGFDTVVGGTGSETIEGVGGATIFAGASTATYNNEGGSALVIGGTVAGSGALNVYGGTGAVTVYGGTGDVAAYGGASGNNILVSGSGNASLVGGGNNDLLVASGAGTTTLVAGTGNETLFGGGSSGVTNYFLGDGSDTVVAGTGSEYIQYGTGNSTIFGSTGSDVYGLLNTQANAGATDLVIGFNAAVDVIELQGFGITAADAFSSAVTVDNGSTFINAGNGASIELYGVTNLTAANFTSDDQSQMFGSVAASITHHG